MTGLKDTDVRLSDEWRLTQAADGDAPLCSDLDCLYQNIILEALTQPGDLFYDLTFGLEIAQRARVGLQKREVILPESIEVNVDFEDDAFVLYCNFQFIEEETARALTVIISAVSVEVKAA